MRDSFTFLIHPLSLERGFTLECEGILAEPMQFCRLFEALLAAAQIGQHLAAVVHIFNTLGEIAETLQFCPDALRELAPA